MRRVRQVNFLLVSVFTKLVGNALPVVDIFGDMFRQTPMQQSRLLQRISWVM
jgi:hypothetical protein